MTDFFEKLKDLEKKYDTDFYNGLIINLCRQQNLICVPFFDPNMRQLFDVFVPLEEKTVNFIELTINGKNNEWNIFSDKSKKINFENDLSYDQIISKYTACAYVFYTEDIYIFGYFSDDVYLLCKRDKFIKLCEKHYKILDYGSVEEYFDNNLSDFSKFESKAINQFIYDVRIIFENSMIVD